MKKTINGFTNKYTAVSALLILFLVVLGCGGKPDMPAESVTQGLVKTSLSDLNDAIDKGDFKAFREKASKDFQNSVTDDQLKSTFKTFVEKKDILLPIMREAAGKDAKFTTPPSMREENGNYVLVANGTSAAEDAAVLFENEWVWRDGAWKLLKIKVNVK